MKKISLIILASLFLTACSGLRTDPPHNLDNACSIKKERKSWYRSMVRAERRWGVPVPVMMASIIKKVNSQVLQKRHTNGNLKLFLWAGSHQHMGLLKL